MATLMAVHARSDARLVGSAGDATTPLALVWVEKKDVCTSLSALDDHLLVVTTAGHQDGTAFADGCATPAQVSNRPGSLCFLPRARAARLDLRGAVSYLELLIGRDTMHAAAAELVSGDPAGLELASFNSLLDPDIERLAVRAAAHLCLHRGGDTPVDDAFALALCAELVAGYARAPAHLRVGRPEKLAGLRLVALLDQLEHGSEADRRLEALARTAGLPPLAFLRAFRAEIGLSLEAFLAQRRIDRLRERLDATAANEPLDLQELAGDLGYSGPSGLERACLDALGTTPAGYLASRGRR